MSDTTVVGLPLEGLTGEVFTPLEALVIIRALNDEGGVCYYARATEGLTTVEALGMAHAAAEKLRAQAAADMA